MSNVLTLNMVLQYGSYSESFYLPPCPVIMVRGVDVRTVTEILLNSLMFMNKISLTQILLGSLKVLWGQ